LPAYPQALEQAPHLKGVARLGNLIGSGDTRLLETSLPALQFARERNNQCDGIRSEQYHNFYVLKRHREQLNNLL
jgi:hypothetical protein